MGSRVCARYRNPVIVHVGADPVVQMSLVEIVHVVAMNDGSVPAVRSMDMGMLLVRVGMGLATAAGLALGGGVGREWGSGKATDRDE